MCILLLAFSQSEKNEISSELEEYLKSVAVTGQTLYAVSSLPFVMH